MSMFRVLHTPVTSAPNALAIWTANVPTPPDAPLMSTFWPGCTLPWSRSSWRAVVAETPRAAACSNVRLAGLGDEVVRWSTHVLGEGACRPAEDLVARSELGHILADRLDGARDIGPRDPVLRPARAGREAQEVGQAPDEDPVPDVDRCRVDAHQHLAITDGRLVDVLELECFLRAVVVLDDRLHVWLAFVWYAVVRTMYASAHYVR